MYISTDYWNLQIKSFRQITQLPLYLINYTTSSIFWDIKAYCVGKIVLRNCTQYSYSPFWGRKQVSNLMKTRSTHWLFVCAGVEETSHLFSDELYRFKKRRNNDKVVQKLLPILQNTWWEVLYVFHHSLKLNHFSVSKTEFLLPLLLLYVFFVFFCSKLQSIYLSFFYKLAILQNPLNCCVSGTAACHSICWISLFIFSKQFL